MRNRKSNNRNEQNKNFHKGRRDGRRGKSNSPSKGFNWKIGLAAGALLAGPAGGLLGAILGDSDKETARKRRNNKAYKRGNNYGRKRRQQ